MVLAKVQMKNHRSSSETEESGDYSEARSIGISCPISIANLHLGPNVMIEPETGIGIISSIMKDDSSQQFHKEIFHQIVLPNRYNLLKKQSVSFDDNATMITASSSTQSASSPSFTSDSPLSSLSDSDAADDVPAHMKTIITDKADSSHVTKLKKVSTRLSNILKKADQRKKASNRGSTESPHISDDLASDIHATAHEKLYEYGTQMILQKREDELTNKIQKHLKELTFEVQWRLKQQRMAQKWKEQGSEEIRQRLCENSRIEIYRMEGRRRREDIARKAKTRSDQREKGFHSSQPYY